MISPIYLMPRGDWKKCWKNRFRVKVPGGYWLVGQQFSSMFTNHPFWAYRFDKKHWWSKSRLLGVYVDAFYIACDPDEAYDTFESRVAKHLRAVEEGNYVVCDTYLVSQ